MNSEHQRVVFLLNGKQVEIDFAQPQPWTPDTPVLWYLRSLPGHSGTKEGCAEGDCGACSVVLAENDGNGKLKYRTVDSCLLLLPMLHGKQIITVEGLGCSGKLHPVQQAMVDHDGSQCGYCTPGFVMSMFGLYKQGQPATRDQILDGLTGNLCRCTGYRSILQAAESACANPLPDSFSENEVAVAAQLEQINRKTLQISHGGYHYFRPTELMAALDFRHQFPESILVSGATDLALKVTKQKQSLKALIDLSAVPEMRMVSEQEDGVEFGAAVSLEQVKSVAKGRFPALYDMLAVFGSKQIREQGTLGGNIANASPIGDMPPVLMALDASVRLASRSGAREMKLADFITGYRTTALKPDEIILNVWIPDLHPGMIVSAYKVSKRKDLDISTVSGGFRLLLTPEYKVQDIQLYYGGMAAMTKRAYQAEEFLAGNAWSEANILHAMTLIDQEFIPISDARSGKEGRRIMARNLLLKFWEDTTRQMAESVNP